MAIDTSIYNALGRGVKTARDWEQEDEQRAGSAQSRELNALTLQGARDTAEQNALARRRTGEVQGALMGLGPQATPEKVAGVYSQYGMADQADKVLTSASTRAKSQSELIDAGLQRGRGMLQFVNTPQAAKRWWQAQYADPVVGPYLQRMGPIEEQFREVPDNPDEFGKWRMAASMLPDKFHDLIAKQQDSMREQEWKQREFGLKQANEYMTVGPDGKTVPNAPYIAAKAQVGRASASNTNIKVDAKLGEGLAKEVGPMMASSLESANGAMNQLQTAQQISAAVDSGKVIAGPGASWRMSAKQLGQTLGVGGKDDAEIIANTRQVIQGLAQSTVNARKQVAGQGSLSDNEQALLQRATSGNIDEMTAPEIRQLAQLNMRLSRQVVQQHNKRVEKLKSNPATSGMSDFYEPVPLSDGLPPAGAPGMPDVSAIDAELARRAKGK